MTVQEMLEKKIAEIEEEISECNRIIEQEKNSIKENLTDNEKLFIELAFGSMEKYKELTKEVIADQEEKLEELEKRLQYFKGMRQEEKCSA